jgi:ApbE superfamily uncharacterized protein (UPF0280 family)
MYQPRTYRQWIKDSGLVSFNVVVKETDLHIRAERNLESQSLESMERHRQPLENYIRENPFFLYTLESYEVEETAPEIVKIMAEAGRIADVGPMAAVAGAIAELVGRDLLEFSPEIIVENGGDIFLKITSKRHVGVYAGDASPFSGKLALEIAPEDTPLGICTSSGTVGHSLSLGRADAIIVMAQSTALADAVATAIGNRIQTTDDINAIITNAGLSYGISGLVIIKDDKIGIWGNVKLVS